MVKAWEINLETQYHSLITELTIVSVGAYRNQVVNGLYSGHVHVYSWDENENVWTQLGKDIDGEFQGDYFGWSVCLSANGKTVAVGAPQNNGGGSLKGHVRVHTWDGKNWTQVGNDIDGEYDGDSFGYSVSLSDDGMIVAAGARRNDENGVDSGHVRVYKWDGQSWNQIGNNIHGIDKMVWSGHSASLLADGSIVAIGAIAHLSSAFGCPDTGHVRMLEWNGIDWYQLGDVICGEVAFMDQFGFSVSLSAGGLIVAASSTGNADVRVFSFS
eukprot:CCRYP_012936-RA/>CCRYP_012936-RA protein AED:0.26 eAED:0.13 QI:0/-1/0/1/-1/1/1/0/270